MFWFHHSLEKITSVATLISASHYFAGAAAANAHDVNVNTEAYIGTDKAADADETTISNAGSVSVTADDNATLKANAGSAAVTISGTGAGSGTLSAAVEVLDKNVKATVGKANIAAQNLTAKANNVGSVLTTANGVAVTVALYGGALSGSASESIVDYHTDAHIADGANITVISDVIVDADSSFSHTGEAAAAAGSTLASAGLSNDTTVLNTETLAYIGDNAQVSAKDIDITANNSVSITSAVAAASAALVGGNGSVGVNDIDSITKAYVGASANVIANGTATDEGITVAAEDTTTLSGGSGGATAGVGNGGAAVNVNNLNKDTQAYIDSNSAVNSKGILSVNAKNNEDIYNLTIQGTGGLAAGVAGAAGLKTSDDLVANLKGLACEIGLDILAERNDLARSFMAELNGAILEGITLVFMHVRAANATTFDLHENFIRADLGDCNFLQHHLARLFKNRHFALFRNGHVYISFLISKPNVL